VLASPKPCVNVRAKRRDHRRSDVPRNLVMKGYLKNESDQRGGLPRLFSHRDLSFLYTAGYVIINDRSKDISISGGENISSVEVEDILYYKHPPCSSRRWWQTGFKLGRIGLSLRRTEGRPRKHRTEDQRVLPQPHVPRQYSEGRGVRDHPEDVTGEIQKFRLRKSCDSAKAILA